MSVRPRGDSYQADVTVKGKRYRGTFDNRTLAQTWEAQVKMCLSLGLTPPVPELFVTQQLSPKRSQDSSSFHANPITIKEAGDKTHRRYWHGTETSQKNLANIKAQATFFGPETYMHDIDTTAVDEYIQSLEDAGNSNATINRKLATLSKVFHYCKDRQHLDYIPKFDRKKESAGRIRWIDGAEEIKIIDTFTTLKKEVHKEAFIVLIDTGLRMGELWQLEARDVDIKKSHIHIWKNKTELPRTVPLTQRARKILENRMALFGSGRLFPDSNNFWFGNGWDRMREKLGLSKDKQFIPYACRHTCASRLVQRGVALLVVKEWLGHRTISTTMRYAHLSPSNLHDAVKVLEAAE